MNLINIPLGGTGDLTVDENAGTFTVEIKAEVLGTPEDVQLQFGVKTVLTYLLNGMTNPIAKAALSILLNLFV